MPVLRHAYEAACNYCLHGDGKGFKTMSPVVAAKRKHIEWE
jgi:hypothetical protein